ncbi:hypothetical protein [Nonomuraea sp. NPDC049480]|uniref:hypothetical protein n=1 Tax=Nonomuraea sp. NPDC049480 TaxID=3364353 RepID=UPI00379A708F
MRAAGEAVTLQHNGADAFARCACGDRRFSPRNFWRWSWPAHDQLAWAGWARSLPVTRRAQRRIDAGTGVCLMSVAGLLAADEVT